MYASKTKRLCVREGPSDDSRVQHHSIPEAITNSVEQPGVSSSYQTTQDISSITGDKMIEQTTSSSEIISKNSTQIHHPSIETSSKQVQNDNLSHIGNHINGIGNGNTLNGRSDKTTFVNTISSNRRVEQPTDVWVILSSYRLNMIDSIDELDPKGSGYDNLEILLDIRNQITSSNKKKLLLVNHPKFIKLVHLLRSENSNPNLKCHLALLFCSIAKSGEEAVLKLINQSVHLALYMGLNSDFEPLIDACLRCLRSIVSWPSSKRTWIFYGGEKTNSNISNTTNQCSDRYDNGLGMISLKKMMSFARKDKSIYVKECISDIFAFTCVSEYEQECLFKANALTNICSLLESISSRVVISSINWLAQMCANNPSICKKVANLEGLSSPILSRLRQFMTKDRFEDLQFVAARCYTFIYREIDDDSFRDDPALVSHVLSCLCRMVKEEKAPILRYNAAECIAYLIEDKRRLQEIASNCDELIDSLVKMLEYEQDSLCDQFHLDEFDRKHLQLFQLDYTEHDAEDHHRHQHHHRYHHNEHHEYHELENLKDNSNRGQYIRKLNLISRPTTLGTRTLDLNSSQKQTLENEKPDIKQEMTQAAFLALAVLGSTQESIRKKIFNNPPVMKHLVRNLSETNKKTLRATLTCLLSLSRSIQQLRTTFVETSVYHALKHLLAKTSDDLLILVLAILCNVSVEFSPGKQQFLDDDTIETLCDLTHSPEPTLRLHGMWILMNIVYQDKNQSLKIQIINTLGMSHITELLENETNEDIAMKTLGFLRNVLSQTPDIDAIMKMWGEQIVKSLIRIIESDTRSRDIQEQTLCVLTNIADGSQESKELVMNQKILSYLARTISNEDAGNLRRAAICCVTNLIYTKTEGSWERQAELKKYEIDQKIRNLLNTADLSLSDIVRTAHNQFVKGDRSDISFERT